MYGFLHDLLSDKKGGEIFTLFSPWHFFYIALALASVIIILFAFKGKGDHKSRESVGYLSALLLPCT